MICPCQKLQTQPKLYEACCAPFHKGRAPANCEQLMRSRFSAYVLGLTAYLSQTWHSATRPESLQEGPDNQWLKLDIVSSTASTVHFKAYFQDADELGYLEETSRFENEDGRLVYVDGSTQMKPYQPKRNDPCWCGSAKKYKKCCGA